MQIRGSLAAVLALVGFLTLVASNGVKDAKRGAESRPTDSGVWGCCEWDRRMRSWRNSVISRAEKNHL